MVLFDGNLHVCRFVLFLDEDYCSEMLMFMNRMPYWKGHVVKQNYVNYDVLMNILDNYMFRPLLAIFRLSSRGLKVLLFIMCAHVLERSLHLGFVA